MNEQDILGLNLGLFDDDFLGLIQEPLPDFFGDDADLADIDALIQSFEQEGHFPLDKEQSNVLIPINAASSLEVGNSNRIEVKVKNKAKHVKPENVVVKKQSIVNPVRRRKGGISLLAKPVKVRSKLTKGKTISPSRFAYFYQDHNYCPMHISTAAQNLLQEPAKSEEKKSTSSETERGEYFNDLTSISMELECEVIMNLEVDELIDHLGVETFIDLDAFDCESLYGAEIAYSSSNETDCLESCKDKVFDAVVETSDLETLNSPNSANYDRLNCNSPIVKRIRKFSTRSSVSSSRSSSVSSTCSSCCRSRSREKTVRERSRSRSRSSCSSSGSDGSQRSRSPPRESRRDKVNCNAGKFRRKRSWKCDKKYSNTTYSRNLKDSRNYYPSRNCAFDPIIIRK